MSVETEYIEECFEEIHDTMTFYFWFLVIMIVAGTFIVCNHIDNSKTSVTVNNIPESRMESK